MKIVKNGRVYGLGYNEYETVTILPSQWRSNSVGNLRDVKRELRRDQKSGEFYVLSSDEGYHRSSYLVEPVSKDEAARIAEDFLDYEEYVRFFGDPEGADAGLVRERDKAVEEKNAAEQSKEYWYKECDRKNHEVSELETRVAELEAKLGAKLEAE